MIRGVCWSANNRRWRASLRGYGANGYVGEYLTMEEAIAARQAAEVLVDGRLHDQASVEVDGDIARIPLWGQRGVLKGWATVDAGDLPLVASNRWSLNPNGYPVARIGGLVLAMHIVILPGPHTRDHVNGDTLDNRRSNLRRCTQRENSRNQRGSRNNPTGFKGVRQFANGRCEARIMVDGRTFTLGRFDEPEDAARAYDAGAIKHFGEFARLNFPLQPQGAAA